MLTRSKLGRHRVLRSADEGFDRQTRLDPLEEQLPLPAVAIESGLWSTPAARRCWIRNTSVLPLSALNRMRRSGAADYGQSRFPKPAIRVSRSGHAMHPQCLGPPAPPARRARRGAYRWRRQTWPRRTSIPRARWRARRQARPAAAAMPFAWLRRRGAPRSPVAEMAYALGQHRSGCSMR